MGDNPSLSHFNAESVIVPAGISAWAKAPMGKRHRYVTRISRGDMIRATRSVTRGKFFAERGYVVVVQDVRGRYDSDGDHPLLMVQEEHNAPFGG